jgi:hypothetical protein
MVIRSGIIDRSSTECIVLSVPAAEALAKEAARRNAKRIFLMASRSLNEHTDEIAQIGEALGDRLAMIFTGSGNRLPMSGATRRRTI